MNIQKTRFPELGFEKHARNLWRFVDTETNQNIGPRYATKAELMADIERFFAERFF